MPFLCEGNIQKTWLVITKTSRTLVVCYGNLKSYLVFPTWHWRHDIMEGTVILSPDPTVCISWLDLKNPYNHYLTLTMSFHPVSSHIFSQHVPFVLMSQTFWLNNSKQIQLGWSWAPSNQCRHAWKWQNDNTICISLVKSDWFWFGKG